ncbi:MAG: DUF2798 domain-containing protein [Spirochaetaceae bacterium]|jgi:hypothetical protein|nr:DUF2798 domain-containing protein [Spirochaetaceae bacterium]
MPKTTAQRILFTGIGVFFTVIVMAVYNKSIVAGAFTWALFRQLPLAFCQRAPLAFVLQFFVVQKFAGKMSAKYPTDNKLLYRAIRTGFTVLIMCPVMSLYSNILYEGFTLDLIPLWITKMAQNWTFAFFVQIFLLGPLNRFLFGLMFKPED